MALDIQVALIADPNAAFEPGPIDDAFYAQPFGERTKVRLQVEPGESLASGLERAAASMDLRPPDDNWMGGHFDATHRKVLFYKRTRMVRFAGHEAGFASGS